VEWKRDESCEESVVEWSGVEWSGVEWSGREMRAVSGRDENVIDFRLAGQRHQRDGCEG
jgi:hypothetical protein